MMLTSGNGLLFCTTPPTFCSNDNTRPTTDFWFIPFGGSGGDVGVVDVVCEAVVVGATTAAVAGAERIVWADVLVVWVVVVGTAAVGFIGLLGLIGLTGLVGFVGLLRDFLHVSDIVTQGANTGCPYGSGQEDVRVWVIKPI